MYIYMYVYVCNMLITFDHPCAMQVHDFLRVQCNLGAVPCT